jgi:hypothetical protein
MFEKDIYEDNWGFYVDIEAENKPVYEKLIKIKKQPLTHLTYTNDYYDYYYDSYNESYYEFDSMPPPINDEKVSNLLIKVSSTTLVTIGLTYLIFCII